MTLRERLAAESKQRIIDVAERMLKGKIHLVEGARQICNLRLTVDDPHPDDPIYDVFIMIKYETHDLPVSLKKDTYYSPLMIQAHEKIQEYAHLLKPIIEKACKEIIYKLSDDVNNLKS